MPTIIIQKKLLVYLWFNIFKSIWNLCTLRIKFSCSVGSPLSRHDNKTELVFHLLRYIHKLKIVAIYIWTFINYILSPIYKCIFVKYTLCNIYNWTFIKYTLSFIYKSTLIDFKLFLIYKSTVIDFKLSLIYNSA